MRNDGSPKVHEERGCPHLALDINELERRRSLLQKIIADKSNGCYDNAYIGKNRLKEWLTNLYVTIDSIACVAMAYMWSMIHRTDNGKPTHLASYKPLVLVLMNQRYRRD